MKTDRDRWAELLRTARVARVRIKALAYAMSERGVEVALAHHVDVALRRLASGPNGRDPPIDEVKAIAKAITDLLRLAAGTGVDETTLCAALGGRQQLVASADAFLVDTQTL